MTENMHACARQSAQRGLAFILTTVLTQYKNHSQNGYYSRSTVNQLKTIFPIFNWLTVLGLV